MRGQPSANGSCGLNLVEGAVDSIYDGLRWMGVAWDEGPREGGPHAPYIQSERLPRYQRAAQELVDKGLLPASALANTVAR